jgi:hypothetical protein
MLIGMPAFLKMGAGYPLLMSRGFAMVDHALHTGDQA